MRARQFAIAALFLAFVWLAVASPAATDAGRGPKVRDGGSLVQQSNSAATIVVGDRGTKVRSIGWLLADGAFGVAASASAILCVGAACIARATVARPLTRYESLERGPPVF